MGAEPKVSIVVLAAGLATRTGSNGGHKLLAMFDRMPLVRRSALVAKASTALSIVVVVGIGKTISATFSPACPCILSSIQTTERACRVHWRPDLPLL
ncbi:MULTISPECIES: NTP transferase domain-containing protein [Rhizobium]|uniref:NTP transferase domain-containing protein n=1 Tax=Rhizobium TaxID=379 RepID=UPI002F2B2BDA